MSGEIPRLLEEVRAVGCVCYAVVEGVPDILYDPYNAGPTVVALHEPDDEIYRTQDLETTAASLQTLLPSDPDTEWQTYLAIQTNLIIEKRHEAYVALDAVENWRESLAKAGNFGQWLTNTMAEIAAVEAAYPFPGDY